jgi:hypothetical protein
MIAKCLPNILHLLFFEFHIKFRLIASIFNSWHHRLSSHLIIIININIIYIIIS